MQVDSSSYNRSSSPLKRRASSMDPHNNDIEMAAAKQQEEKQQVQQSEKDQQMLDADQPTEFPREMSVDPSSESLANSDMSPQEVAKTIQTLIQAHEEKPLAVGDPVYVVSRSWVNKALSYGDEKNTGQVKHPGPIDNSDIINEVFPLGDNQYFTSLIMGAGRNDWTLLPEDAWKLLVSWCQMKADQYPIIRYAADINGSGTADSIDYEMYPIIFQIHRVWSSDCPIKVEQTRRDPPLYLVRSEYYRYQDLLKEVKNKLQIPMERKIKFARINKLTPFSAPTASTDESALTPPQSPAKDSRSMSEAAKARATWPTLLVSSEIYKKSNPNPINKNQTVNPNFNGKSNLSMSGFHGFEVVAVEEQVIPDVFVCGYVSRMNNIKPKTLRVTNISPKTSSSTSSQTESNAGPSTRNRSKNIAKKRHSGAVGLSNLGNTCYMNSALQCVRSVEELSKYFISGSYLSEINYENPLAYHGRMANAYGELLKNMYLGNNDSVRPTSFKSTVGQCRPSFAGYAQHDSQEFLGFLLDALQEDLSRVKSKPYIEKPDSTDEMVNNPEVIAKMADQVWDITRRRDDSVIADLFTGLYKSTLNCPVCKKVSITFDPFNNLTLQLPVDTVWTRTIRFYPLNDRPVKLDVELPASSSYSVLKAFISGRTGVPLERLFGAEEYGGKFFKFYSDQIDLSSDIQTKDEAAFHELEMPPTNFAPETHHNKYQRRSMLDVSTSPSLEASFDDRKYDRLIVPVFHRIGSEGSYKTDENVSPPHFITLTREEAYSEDIIRRKILEKVATFSTWTTLHGDFSPLDDHAPSTEDEDNVVAKSVESEDDMVSINMSGSTSKDKELKTLVQANAEPTEPINKTADYPDKLHDFNTWRPKWVNPQNMLDPILQNLFDICYFQDRSGSLPTGWDMINTNKTFHRISERIVREETPEAEGSDVAGSESTTEAGSEDEAVVEPVPATIEIENSPQHQHKLQGREKAALRAGKRGKKPRGRRAQQQAVSKKGKKAAPNFKDETPPPSADNGPLIRLNEGLVIDWKDNAWDMVFGQCGKSNSDTQGAPTFRQPPLISDPILQKKRSQRVSRKNRDITLYECLEEFEKAEILSEQDMWYCPRCKEHRRASKKVDLWKTPDILICHLKRFSSAGWRRDKLDHKVDFPLEGLNLERHVLHKEVGKSEIYDLIAIDEHYGGLGGGHYTATAKNFIDGNWYSFNDSSVSRVRDPTGLSSSAAYLLFYRRRTNGVLGGPKFAEIIRSMDGDDSSSTSSGEDDGRGATLRQSGRSMAARKRVTSSSDEESSSVHTSIEDDIQDAEDEVPNGKGINHVLTTNWGFDQLSTAMAKADDDSASMDAHGDADSDASQEVIVPVTPGSEDKIDEIRPEEL